MENTIPINEEISSRLDTWNRIEALLTRDENYTKNKLCIQFPNESQSAYEERKKYFNRTFVNITQDLVNAPVNTIFRQGLKDEFRQDNTTLEKFHNNVNIGENEISLSDYIQTYVAPSFRSYGNICSLIELPGITVNNRQQQQDLIKPYITNIKLQDIINWQYYNDQLIWFAYKGAYSKLWQDPISEPTPESQGVTILWTLEKVYIIGDNQKIIDSWDNKYGIIPIVMMGTFYISPENRIGNAAMFQSSQSIVIMNNLLNQGVYELFKHGGSLLLMHEDSMLATNLTTDNDGESKIKRLDYNGMLTMSGEVEPKYLVKELKTEDIMEWAMYYKKEAIENERDLRSVANKGVKGKTVQESGFAKVIDREPLETNLIALSNSCELYTKKINKIVNTLTNEKTENIFEFDKDYDMRTLKQKYEDMQIAIKNRVNDISPTLYKELWKNIAPENVKDHETLDKIFEEIESYKDDDFDDENNEIIDQFNNLQKK